MNKPFVGSFSLVLALVWAGASGQRAMAQPAAPPVGVVAHLKVLSDKVPDVSSMEAWKKSFIRDDMSDKEKVLTFFKSKVMFVYQDSPPQEYLSEGGCVHDPIKEFNVYGYGMCCCASSNMEAFARYLGMEARGWGINGHSVPEVSFDGSWHLIDSSLISYFTKPDGTIASVAEIVASIKDWLAKNPGYQRNDDKLRAFQASDGWTGWKQGPELLRDCTLYDKTGWWLARTHGWYSTMQEYDGTNGTPFPYEYGYSQGYQVNIELRPGEKLTRNWFPLKTPFATVNGAGNDPGCLTTKIGEGFMAYLPQYGDLTHCRVGSAHSEYAVPLGDANFKYSAWRMENLVSKGQDNTGPVLHLHDASQPGILEIDMPTSYVYLAGTLGLNAIVGDGGSVKVLFSENNGLDWKQLAALDKSGSQTLSLNDLVLRRYDYRLRFVIQGSGSGLESLKISHDMQCSQRALPTLDVGDNTISLSTGPQEGTVTIECSSTEAGKGKQVEVSDFHPVLDGIVLNRLVDQNYGGKSGNVTFPITTPADMVRLRFGCHYRLRGATDKYEYQVSFDDGKSFKTIDTETGPVQGRCKYVTFSDIPAGTRQAQVRFSGLQQNTACILALRIDADYKLPNSGFRPVKITYAWEEGGIPKQDIHIAQTPDETYKIRAESKPIMKSLTMELAQPGDVAGIAPGDLKP
jgi:hypothetical protein